MNKENTVNICFIDPVSLEQVEAGLVDLIKEVKNSDTIVEIVTLSPALNIDHLLYHSFEARIVGHLVDIVQGKAGKHIDGFIIGCFYDPALEEVREVSGDSVVVAPCQASLQMVSSLANRFSVIAPHPKSIHKIHQNVIQYGSGHSLASVRTINMAISDLQNDSKVTEDMLKREVKAAIEEDRAEAIVLGCTMEYGFYKTLQEEFGIPVIDPVVAAFKMCELLAGLKKQCGWTPSRKWSCEPPPENELRKFQPDLNALIGPCTTIF